ncbi:MAG: hypothetical protein KKA32_18235 [Actinobacteria bacterium]|nr:hypothetical protein [Actinomycetota bacterium]
MALLATLSQKGRRLFNAAEAEPFWGNAAQARKALARLNEKGWLERLDRGRYMIVPLEAGMERKWSEDSLAVGTFLAPEGAAAYWTAVQYWGWTTQLPATVLFATPTQRHRARPTVLGVHYRFVRVKPERVFGIHETREGELRIRVTDRERTVIDIVDRTDLSGALPEVSAALGQAWPELDLDRLTQYISRFGSGTVPKRLGFLAERLKLADPDQSVTETWRRMIGKGVSLLERGGPQQGPIVSRWRLRVNTSRFLDPEVTG